MGGDKQQARDNCLNKSSIENHCLSSVFRISHSTHGKSTQQGSFHILLITWCESRAAVFFFNKVAYTRGPCNSILHFYLAFQIVVSNTRSTPCLAQSPQRSWIATYRKPRLFLLTIFFRFVFIRVPQSRSTVVWFLMFFSKNVFYTILLLHDDDFKTLMCFGGCCCKLVVVEWSELARELSHNKTKML